MLKRIRIWILLEVNCEVSDFLAIHVVPKFHSTWWVVGFVSDVGCKWFGDELSSFIFVIVSRLEKKEKRIQRKFRLDDMCKTRNLSCLRAKKCKLSAKTGLKMA